MTDCDCSEQLDLEPSRDMPAPSPNSSTQSGSAVTSMEPVASDEEVTRLAPQEASAVKSSNGYSLISRQKSGEPGQNAVQERPHDLTVPQLKSVWTDQFNQLEQLFVTYKDHANNLDINDSFYRWQLSNAAREINSEIATVASDASSVYQLDNLEISISVGFVSQRCLSEMYSIARRMFKMLDELREIADQVGRMGGWNENGHAAARERLYLIARELEI